MLCALAEVAADNGYVRPEVDFTDEIHIEEGRHPVVEKMLKDTLFVPNDTELGTAANRVSVITGPNMAGKSTYMRQVALIVLMAQIGSFVPAKSARIGICDRVFTRIGASDDLSAGQSTFMVEMSEVAEILKNATARSLLILDEIGRGTSTFDAWPLPGRCLEYCASPKKLGAKGGSLPPITMSLPSWRRRSRASKLQHCGEEAGRGCDLPSEDCPRRRR